MSRGKLIVAWVAAAIGISTALLLGNWQTRRGDAKLILQAQADTAERAEPIEIAPTRAAIEQTEVTLPRRVRISGVFDAAGTVYLDNRTLNGAAGVYVLTPLVIGPELPVVLIDRGWKARNMQDRARVEAPLPPSDRVSIEGLAVARPSMLLELGGKPEHRVPGLWQNLDYAAYEHATGRSVARFVIRQIDDGLGGTARSGVSDGLRREWLRPASGVERHRGYAFQWYSLATLIAVLTILLSWKHRHRR